MENKTSKYFKYAIGEIILVVIGILIALQINNWNENRKNTALEQDYYCRILEDFRLTQTLIEKSNSAVTQQIEYGKQLIIDMHKSTKTRETILNDWLKVIRLEKFVPSNASYQDILASGNLKLFKDVAVKNSLAIYYANLENILTQMNQNRDKIVESSFQLKPTYFGLQDLGYLKESLGEEIMTLLPNSDWVHDPKSEIFRSFQDDLVMNIALLERHKQHMSRIANEMQKPNQLLNTKCLNTSL